MSYDLRSPEVTFAIHAATRASQAAERVKAGARIDRLTKEDLSPVTVADFAAQALVAQALLDSFPKSTLVAEEDARDLASEEGRPVLGLVTDIVSEFETGVSDDVVRSWIDMGGASPGETYWTLDPIDGTKGYLRDGQYAVALALIEGGEVQIGVLACPNLICTSGRSSSRGRLVVATRGGGCWGSDLGETPEFSRLSVSGCSKASEARLLRSVESGHTDVSGIEAVAAELGLGADPVLMDSQAKYVLLATGEAELLFRLLSPSQPDYKEKIWDQAAGSLVVEEAGGRVTDLEGRALDFGRGRTLEGNTGVCATNGHLHEAALEALRSR